MKKATLILFIISLHVLSAKLHAQCAAPIDIFPYQENFETSDGGWTAGGYNSDWAWGTPHKMTISGAASGNNCWITGGLMNSSYANGENSYLNSPCFDLAPLTHPMLSFSVFWETEKRFDGANLQYSTDAGAVWQPLGVAGSDPCVATNWYNNSGITYLGAVGWSGNVQSTNGSCLGGDGSRGWATATHDLQALAGKKVIFRFHFAAGTTCNDFDGFAMDLFTITEASTAPANFTYSCGPDNTISFTSHTPTCPTGYTWDFDDPSSGTNNTSTLANPSHQFISTGNHTVTLTISYAAAPPAFIPQRIEVIDVDLTVTNPISCNGDNTGSITATATGSTSPYQYTWSNSGNTPTISNLVAGVYSATVSTPNSCPLTRTTTINEPLPIQIVPVVNDAICTSDNGSINTTVTGGTAPYQYTWSNGGNTATIGNLVPGNYTLAIKDNNNCSVALNDIVVARQNKTLPVSLGSDTYVCPGTSIVLRPGIFSSYSWQDNSTLPTYTVTSAGNYNVSVTDKDGCKGSATVKITADCGDIYFPTAFTPNGDAVNPTFGALGNIVAVSNYTFKVFNRWGQLLFASTDPAKRWDGSMNGSKYNSGSFVWKVTYDLRGEPRAQQGMVTLIR